MPFKRLELIIENTEGLKLKIKYYVYINTDIVTIG